MAKRLGSPVKNMISPFEKTEDEEGVTSTDLPLVGPPVALKSSTSTGALVARGSFWSMLQTLGSKTVMMLGHLVLGWLLTREDYGQFGMATTVLAFVTLLINPGIDVILVRRGRHFHLWSTPAFYFSLATGALGCATILAVAPLAARFYGDPKLVGLLTVLAFATPLGSLLLVPTAKLRSQLRFKALAVLYFFQATLQTLLTISFAACGFGVYSFVLPMPIVYATNAALLWFVARPSIGSRRLIQYWRYLIGDSGYIFGTSLLQTIVGQGDYIILGGLYGAAMVGPYFFAYVFALQAIRLTAGSLQAVLLAGLSRMPAYSTQQTQAAMRATRAMALFGMPLCLMQAALADPLLRALYGDKWVAAIPLVQLISVGMAFDLASWPAVSLMQSRGQFRLIFFYASICAPIFILAVFIGAWYGEATGVAMALCGYYTLLAPLFAIWVFRTSNVEWRVAIDMLLRPLCVGLLAAGASFGAVHLATMANLHPAVQFGAGAIAGLVTMVVSASVIMSASIRDIIERFKHVWPFPLPVIRGKA